MSNNGELAPVQPALREFVKMLPAAPCGFCGRRDAEIPSYPKLGVTAVIRDVDGRLLLGRKGRSCSPELVGKWCTPGGKVEWKETLEAAIMREVMEETNLRVRICAALPPQQWITETAHYLFVPFICRVRSVFWGARAGSDLTELRWWQPGDPSISLDDVTPLTIRVLNSIDLPL